MLLTLENFPEVRLQLFEPSCTHTSAQWITWNLWRYNKEQTQPGHPLRHKYHWYL